MQTLSNAVQLSHILMKNILSRAKVIVDATAGNGSDTLFLAKNALDDATIYAFDIQEKALQNAQLKIEQLKTAGKDSFTNLNINFICDSHDKVNDYVKDTIDLAIFNLGYLPGGNHEITTKCDTTLNALKTMLNNLALNGCIAVVVYPGHDEGHKECQLVKEFAQSLSKKYFTAGWYQMINHNSNAPALCWIEKVGECFEINKTRKN